MHVLPDYGTAGWAKCSSTEPFTKQECECAVPLLAPRTAGRTTRLGSAQHTWKLPPQATKEMHQSNDNIRHGRCRLATKQTSGQEARRQRGEGPITATLMNEKGAPPSTSCCKIGCWKKVFKFVRLMAHNKVTCAAPSPTPAECWATYLLKAAPVAAGHKLSRCLCRFSAGASSGGFGLR